MYFICSISITPFTSCLFTLNPTCSPLQSLSHNHSLTITLTQSLSHIITLSITLTHTKQPGGGSSSSIDRKTSAARLLYQMPPHNDAPHVFLRCNYCSSSLPSDPLQQQQASFFRKQRPLINCCANCKKPLPRCYVCLLYMGLGDPPQSTVLVCTL